MINEFHINTKSINDIEFKLHSEYANETDMWQMIRCLNNINTDIQVIKYVDNEPYEVYRNYEWGRY